MVIMKKLNGFEAYIISESVKHWIVKSEEQVINAEKDGKNSLFAPGYFTMVGKEILEKVNDLTLKKDRK